MTPIHDPHSKILEPRLQTEDSQLLCIRRHMMHTHCVKHYKLMSSSGK